MNDLKALNLETNEMIKVNGGYFKELINNGYSYDSERNILRRIKYFDTLPDEILREIVNNIDVYELSELCMVSRGIMNICKDNKNLGIFENNKYKTLACGGRHTLVIYGNILYGFGSSKSGQLGRIGTFDRPIMIDIKDPLSVSCGSEFSVVVAKGGAYAFGDNSYGQLGMKDKNYNGTIKMINLPGIITAMCGVLHTLILSSEGLYSCGKNDDGQLGFRASRLPGALRKVHIDKVLAISCGGNFSMVLTVNGLYGFGANNHNQIDIGILPYYDSPQRINITDVLSISCGRAHTLVLTSTNVIAFGLNDNGQLGSDDSNINSTIVPLKQISHISCGYGCSFIISNGVLYATGDNRKNQLGLQDYPFVDRFEKVNIVDPIIVASGFLHTIIQTKNGFYGVGDNSSGRLGLGNIMETNEPLPIQLP